MFANILFFMGERVYEENKIRFFFSFFFFEDDKSEFYLKKSITYSPKIQKWSFFLQTSYFFSIKSFRKRKKILKFFLTFFAFFWGISPTLRDFFYIKKKKIVKYLFRIQ